MYIAIFSPHLHKKNTSQGFKKEEARGGFSSIQLLELAALNFVVRKNKVLEIILKRNFFIWIIHLFSSKLLKDLHAHAKCIISMFWKSQVVNHDQEDTLPSIFGLLCDGLNWQVWTLTLNGLIWHALHILLKGSMHRKLYKNNTKIQNKL